MIKKFRFSIFLLGLIGILSACSIGGPEKPNKVNYSVADFTYVNQDNKKVGLEDLKGQVWIADFIFTNCDTVCPPMTANMAKLQQMIKEEGLDARLVSFSVDPEVDTPEILKEYAGKFDADLTNWDFLTGYSQKEIEDFTLNSFKGLVQKTDQSDQVTHGTSFYLIDQTGTILNYYSGTSDTPFEQIISDIKVLTK